MSVSIAARHFRRREIGELISVYTQEKNHFFAKFVGRVSLRRAIRKDMKSHITVKSSSSNNNNSNSHDSTNEKLNLSLKIGILQHTECNLK
mmetsp:Transcript_6732/g.9322  ORF Transcript_6732/g.9322 Transcript_6732/m.9322 type:complete len:91 (+) Transcript_6732:1286-1558(+)